MKKFIFFALLQLFFISLLSAQCKSGDCKNGTGIFIYPSGAKYIGQFKNGEIDGIGACYYTDGKKYQGEWKNRFPEGKGTMTLADGSTWTGPWKKGHPVDRSGNILEDLFADKEADIQQDNIQSGCLAGNCKNGVGVFAYADGSKYEGQFKNGQLFGQGTFSFTNGDKYVGQFLGGFSHGLGTYYHADGSETSGNWKEGEYAGMPVEETGEEGCIAGNCDDGNGTYVYEGGEAKYIGSFKNDLPEGKGTVEYANGERYEGYWKNGGFHGFGTLFTNDNRKVAGWWENGTFMGKDRPDNFGDVAAAKPKPKKNKIMTEEEMKAEIRKKAGFKIYAVVIGVSTYNHMPALRYTDDDAYRMYAFLKSPEGGSLPDAQISVLIDEEATKRNITSTMQRVFGKAGPNDLVMLYFSGHGLKGSFLPIDYDGFNNKLPHEEINQLLADSPAKYKLCIADACHSGSLFAARGASDLNTLENYYTSLAQADAGTALLMSSKSDETSLESSGLRQGVFSHFLIRGLKGEADVDGDKVVSIVELYSFVSKSVRTYTGNRQSPVIKGDYDKKMTVSVVK